MKSAAAPANDTQARNAASHVSPAAKAGNSNEQEQHPPLSLPKEKPKNPDSQKAVATVFHKERTAGERPPFQLKETQNGAGNQDKAISPFILQKKANTTGMPDQLKTGVENLSGIDLSDVKVHYNSNKPAQLNAHAYAQGNQIHIGSGQEKHLPHEAWHVVQQREGRVKPTLQMKSGVYMNDNKGLEQEADAMGTKALQRKTSESAKASNYLKLNESNSNESLTKQSGIKLFPTGKNINYQTAQMYFTHEGKRISDVRNYIASIFAGSDGFNDTMHEYNQFKDDVENPKDISEWFYLELGKRESKDNSPDRWKQSSREKKGDGEFAISIYDFIVKFVNGEFYERAGAEQLRNIQQPADSKNKHPEEEPPLHRSYIDMASLALYKLLGKSDAKGYNEKVALLKNATKATIYKNGTIDAKGLGDLLTIGNDFPGQVYYKAKDISVINILGSGRQKEAQSYLKQIGIQNITLIDLGMQPDDMVAEKLVKAKPYINGKSISLSIMPLSTLAQADKKKAKIIWSQPIGGDANYQFEVVYVKEKLHFIADIRWANGVLVENLLQVLKNWNVTLESVNLYGIAGSLIPVLNPDTLVVPRGEIHSLDKDYKEPVSIPWNDAFIPGAMLTMDHGNVSSILEESDEGVRDLLVSKEIHVVEMEAYHLVKKLESMDYTGKLKIVFKIHDIVTSPFENISIPPPQNAKTLLAKTIRDKIILEAFEIPTT